MPDFTNCVKSDDGDLWCYDKNTDNVYKITLEKPYPAKIPHEVLLKLLKVVSEGIHDGK